MLRFQSTCPGLGAHYTWCTGGEAGHVIPRWREWGPQRRWVATTISGRVGEGGIEYSIGVEQMFDAQDTRLCQLNPDHFSVIPGEKMTDCSCSLGLEVPAEGPAANGPACAGLMLYRVRTRSGHGGGWAKAQLYRAARGRAIVRQVGIQHGRASYRVGESVGEERSVAGDPAPGIMRAVRWERSSPPQSYHACVVDRSPAWLVKLAREAPCHRIAPYDDDRLRPRVRTRE